MVTALESREYDVDWAGSIEDGLASLYARRYDLVIIDLRLSDRRGLQLLRDATDERLLTQSAAIILTGHDFDAPSDIRVFRKGFELDQFLDRIADIVAATRRHRWTITKLPRAGQPHGLRSGGESEGGDHDSVIYAPTLVKRGPGPRTWIVGNLDQDDFLVDLLELSGVERRKL